MNPQTPNPNAPGRQAPKENQPWWRVGMVWLVLAGPVAVILASIVTVNLAITHADPVIQEPARAQASDPSLTPAMKARNHAATPRP